MTFCKCWHNRRQKKRCWKCFKINNRCYVRGDYSEQSWQSICCVGIISVMPFLKQAGVLIVRMQKSHHRGKAFSFRDAQGMSILVFMTQSIRSLVIKGSGKAKLASPMLISLSPNAMPHPCSAFGSTPDHAWAHILNQAMCQGTC